MQAKFYFLLIFYTCKHQTCLFFHNRQVLLGTDHSWTWVLQGSVPRGTGSSWTLCFSKGRFHVAPGLLGLSIFQGSVPRGTSPCLDLVFFKGRFHVAPGLLGLSIFQGSVPRGTSLCLDLVFFKGRFHVAPAFVWT